MDEKTLTNQELLGRVELLKAELDGCEDLENLRQVKDKIDISVEDLKASEENAKLSFVARVGLPLVGTATIAGGIFGYCVVSDIIREGLDYITIKAAPSIEPRLTPADIYSGMREHASNASTFATLFGTALPATLGAAGAYKVYEVLEYFHVSGTYRWIESKFKELHDSCAQKMREKYRM